MEIGADLFAINHQGLSLMHVASQGDQPLILLYLQSQGLPLDVHDTKKGTPLHWAAFSGSDTAASVILAYKNTNPNDKDSEGNTPLHIAVMASNSRIVRNLLLKGANRDMLNNNKESPLDIAREKDLTEFIPMLKHPGNFAECAVRPPIRPPQGNYLSTSTFLLLFGGGAIIIIIFMVEYLPLPAILSFCAQVAVTLILFTILLNRDPGYLFPTPGTHLLGLYETYQSQFICADCRVLRPPRSRHCQCCDRCVEKFDHHCPWINNCVGAKNLGIFFMFIVSTWISLAFCCAVSVIVIKSGHREKELENVSTVVDKVLAGITAFCSVVFLAPVSYLIWVHFNNFRKNKTTNERFGQKKMMSQSRISKMSYIESDQSYCDNYASMCCNKGSTERTTAEFRVADESDNDYRNVIGDIDIGS